ncbi:hypothetical protein CTI12_AA369930 [Artemisia annua]|uniref:Uncharacterized protein n=1 Tax=Artemisia annua TaxID=35608 RepID=A0A2U1MKR1_ARTAN|nr:hypothetical protein CTI12_AA369930 [Artemisia annua]
MVETIDPNTQNNTNTINDPLYLASSDHPAMVLTNTPFNGGNFLGWSRNLWKEVAERYGQSNGPLIYQLERELSKITQGNLTIAAFFNKLKRCWDELQNLNGLPVCNCGKMAECTCV